MKSIRIGNDIRIEWPIVLSGDVSKLQDLGLTVEVRPSAKVVDWHNYIEQPTLHRGKHSVMMNGGIAFRPDIGDGKEHCHPHRPKPAVPYVKLPYHIEDNTLIAMWTADRQFAVGDYDIILYAHKNEGGQAVCDQYRFVRLVAHSAQADAPDDSGIEAVIAMQPVTLELSGLSAYEVAVVNGFQGSEEEWLQSLKVVSIIDLNNEKIEDIKTAFGSGLIGIIELSDLDYCKLQDITENKRPTIYNVMNDGVCVGILNIFGTNTIQAQLFTTNLKLNTEGEFDDKPEQSDDVLIYYRNTKFSSEFGKWGIISLQLPLGGEIGQVLKRTKNGTEWANDISSETIINNTLDSDSTTEALSAKQGKILKREVDKKLEPDDFKTINGQSIVGDEDIKIEGGTSLSANEEDLDISDGVIKFADRGYNASVFSGKGYKILRKNIKENRNIILQNDINTPNTVYVIRYDFDLNGANVTCPDNSVLYFDGGSITNGIIKSQKTIIVNPVPSDCYYGIFYDTNGSRYNRNFKSAKNSIDCVDPIIPYSEQYINNCLTNARKSSIDKMEVIYFLQYTDGIVKPADDLAYWTTGSIQGLVNLAKAQGQTIHSIKFHKNAGFASTGVTETERTAYYNYVMAIVNEFAQYTDTVKAVYISNEEDTRTTAGNDWNITHKALTTTLQSAGYKVGISCNNISSTMQHIDKDFLNMIDYVGVNFYPSISYLDLNTPLSNIPQYIQNVTNDLKNQLMYIYKFKPMAEVQVTESGCLPYSKGLRDPGNYSLTGDLDTSGVIQHIYWSVVMPAVINCGIHELHRWYQHDTNFDKESNHEIFNRILFND